MWSMERGSGRWDGRKSTITHPLFLAEWKTVQNSLICCCIACGRTPSLISSVITIAAWLFLCLPISTIRTVNHPYYLRESTCTQIAVIGVRLNAFFMFTHLSSICLIDFQYAIRLAPKSTQFSLHALCVSLFMTVFFSLLLLLVS